MDATAQTLAKVFGRTPGGDTRVTWTELCAAMEAMGFRREERFGAVVEFFPPRAGMGMEGEEGEAGVVVMRPAAGGDGGEMEEWAVKGVGRRLRGRFGFYR